jgi:hypothetical protein
MLNQNLFKTSVFCAFMAVFFSNCQIYAPATSGNTPVYTPYPWYDGKPVSSVSVSAKGNTGVNFVKTDKNYFAEANAHYSHVFEMGHVSLNGGGYVGQYKIPLKQSAALPYRGVSLGGEVGLHLPSFWEMIGFGMGGMYGKNNSVETTTGIGYEFKTEQGSYFNFRNALPDSSYWGQSARKLNPYASRNLHKLLFFKELRQKIDDNNLHGIRGDFTMAYEGDFFPTSWNTSLTYHFTHKKMTFYGQAGFAASSSDNALKPLFGLGVNCAVWGN